MKDNNIFCSECKYWAYNKYRHLSCNCNFITFMDGIRNDCNHDKHSIKTTTGYSYGDIREINKNNNCSEFEIFIEPKNISSISIRFYIILCITLSCIAILAIGLAAIIGTN